MSIDLRPLPVLAVLLVTAALTAAETPNQLTPAEKQAGWQLLFDGQTTQGWHSFKKSSFPTAAWVVEDGWFHCLEAKGGDIVSDGLYDQFELQWEWKLSSNGNSGVKYFVTDDRSSPLGHEYQMFDDRRDADGKMIPTKHATASFYDVLPPAMSPPASPIGQINHSRILVKGNHVEHWLNGVKVLEYEAGSEAVKAAVARSKFKTTPGFGERLKGHILLQDHESPAWFRNIKIRVLSGS